MCEVVDFIFFSLEESIHFVPEDLSPWITHNGVTPGCSLSMCIPQVQFIQNLYRNVNGINIFCVTHQEFL